MKRKRGVLLLPVWGLLPTIVGCGTMANLPNHSGMVIYDTTPRYRIYGGVLHDLERLGVKREEDNTSCLIGQTQASRTMLKPPESIGGCVDQCLGAALLVVDLPLSAIADTLTLPITITRNRSDSEDNEDAQRTHMPEQGRRVR
jgi:uncharacterized protein YceK